jgi:signal transduction histidine kinase
MKCHIFRLMIRFLLTGLMIFITVRQLQAQNANAQIDSLKNELKRNPDPEKKAALYSDLTWYYSNISIDSALSYGKKALAQTQKIGDSVMLAQVYSDLGAVHFRNGDFDSSEQSYLRAYRIRKARKDFNGLAKINTNLASIYTSRQNYEQAMKAFMEALEYFESTGNLPVANAIKTNVGLLFMELKNYPKAVKYTSEAIAYEEKNKLTNQLCISYLNLGNVYMQMRDTAQALKLYEKSLAACKAAGNQKGISSVYNNIGTIKSGQQKAAEAAALYQRSESVRDSMNSGLDKATLQLNIAREHINNRKYKEARDLLLKVKKTFEKLESNPDLLITYSLLVPVYAHLNVPDSTVHYSTKYSDLKEKMLQAATLKNSAELEAKYQTEKKERLLLEERAEVARKDALLWATAALAFFIALIGYLVFRQQKLKQKQQQQEFKLKEAITQIETQNKLQEQRLSISRDLHDNIGAQLTFIISSVDNIRHAFDIQNTVLNNKLIYISEFTKSTIVELRDTIWAMNNAEIDFEDLRARILNFTENAKIAREDINFNFIIDDGMEHIRLSSIAGMNIYRSIQEAVNNSIKYSEAKNISILTERMGRRIIITITDDGKGFDPSAAPAGNGLLNMRKRIEDLDGEYELDSNINLGTKVTITIPDSSLNSQKP